jgi:2-amino-4-hydroxy-6-hydroxymethyldihydropteridine diphosphokinase
MSSAPIIDAAADGRLPAWAEMSEKRYAHVQRVATLLGEWASSLGLAEDEARRWRAAGYLHDALREVDPAELRALVPEPLRDVAGKLLHGPAAAARLRAEGVADESLLRAISYHTIGHPDLDELGCALFVADYIEPGRRYDTDTLAAFRARMPHERADVLRDVLRARLNRVLHENRVLRPETVAFWNQRIAAARSDGIAL